MATKRSARPALGSSQARVLVLQELVEHHRLGLAGRRVAVDLGEREALVGDEDVGARDAVPEGLRRRATWPSGRA